MFYHYNHYICILNICFIRRNKFKAFVISNDKNYQDPIHYNYKIANQIINSFYIKNNEHNFKIIDQSNYKNLNLYD